MLYPLRLALRRLRVRFASRLLAVAALVVAGGALSAVVGASAVAEDRSLARALGQLDPEDRAIHIAYFGLPPQGSDVVSLDRAVRRSLRPVRGAAGSPPIRVVQLRETRLGGARVTVAALDGARRWIRLRSGRSPRPCTASRCEVVQLAGSGRLPSLPGVRLVRVGRGILRSPLPFARLAPPSSSGYGPQRYFAKQRPPPFLVAEGVGALSRLRALEGVYRSYVWVLPLDPDAVHPWSAGRFDQLVSRLRATLQAHSFRFDVTAPTDAVGAARSRSRTARNHLLLVGGQMAVLLLGFVLLVAGAARRDAEAAAERLTWAGATRWQTAVVSAAEAAVLSAVAVGLGWLIGGAATAAVAAAADAPVRETLQHSLLTGSGVTAILLSALVLATLLVLATRARPVRVGGLALTPLDAAALAALAAIAAGAARGAFDARSTGGEAPLVLLLPGLIILVAAAVAARLIPASMRLLQHAAARASPAARLAALSLARRPGHATVAATFLVVSLAMTIFALVYGETLRRGQSDEAEYALPAAAVLREDLSISRLVAPLEAAPLARYRALVPGGDALPVIRQRGSVSRLGGGQLTFLAVPAAALPRIDGWRRDFSPLRLGEIVRRLDPRPPRLAGPPLPRDARAVVLPVRARGTPVEVSLTVLTPRGDFAEIALRRTSGAALRGSVPPFGRGGRVVALNLALTRASQETGGPDRGAMTLSTLAAVGPSGTRPVTGFRGWIGINGVRRLRPRSPTIAYVVTNQVESRLRPRQRLAAALPVVVTPRLAAAAGEDGILPVRLAGGELVGRVVGIVRRFPSTVGDVVLADEGHAFAFLNTRDPGSGVPNEMWLDPAASTAEQALERKLRRPPFDVLEQRLQSRLRADLRTDPLARASLLMIMAGAAVALALALAGVLLVLATDVRDEQRELFDLAAQGASPAQIRRHLRLRGALLLGLGSAGAVATAAAASAAVVDLVRVTAAGAIPEPPLLLALDWRSLALAFAAYAVVGAAIILTVTRRPGTS